MPAGQVQHETVNAEAIGENERNGFTRADAGVILLPFLDGAGSSWVQGIVRLMPTLQAAAFCPSCFGEPAVEYSRNSASNCLTRPHHPSMTRLSSASKLSVSDVHSAKSYLPTRDLARSCPKSLAIPIARVSVLACTSWNKLARWRG